MGIGGIPEWDLAAALVAAAAGCRNVEEDGQNGSGDADTDADTDADADADTDADADADPGSDDPGVPLEDCDGGKRDSATALCWQEPPSETIIYQFDSAIAYCEHLELGGHADWRLPTISELRSIIRGCPGTVTGGPCDVTDDCLMENDPDCNNDWCHSGCPAEDAPESGCYRAAELTGTCGYTWSASAVVDYAPMHWFVGFERAFVRTMEDGVDAMVARCVRADP